MPTPFVLYNDDPKLIIHSKGKRDAFTAVEITGILLAAHNPNSLSLSTPGKVSHNVSFLLDNSKFENYNDIKCDVLGAWKPNGSPKTTLGVKNEDGIMHIMVVSKGDESMNSEEYELVTLKRSYHRCKSSPDLKKIVSSLTVNISEQKAYTICSHHAQCSPRPGRQRYFVEETQTSFE